MQSAESLASRPTATPEPIATPEPAQPLPVQILAQYGLTPDELPGYLEAWQARFEVLEREAAAEALVMELFASEGDFNNADVIYDPTDATLYITLWSSGPRQTGKSCTEGEVFDQVMEVLGGVEVAKTFASLSNEVRSYERGEFAPWRLLADRNEVQRMEEEGKAVDTELLRMHRARTLLHQLANYTVFDEPTQEVLDERLNEKMSHIDLALDGTEPTPKGLDHVDVRVASPLRAEIEVSLNAAVDRSRSYRESKDLRSRLEFGVSQGRTELADQLGAARAAFESARTDVELMTDMMAAIRADIEQLPKVTDELSRESTRIAQELRVVGWPAHLGPVPTKTSGR